MKMVNNKMSPTPYEISTDQTTMAYMMTTDNAQIRQNLGRYVRAKFVIQET